MSWFQLKSKNEDYWNQKHPVVTQLYKGRPIPGTKQSFEIDVRHFIWDNDAILKQVLKLFSIDTLPYDDAALAIQKYVTNIISYLSDTSLGTTEYWLFPGETFERRKGDCEDGALLIASLILNVLPESEHWRVRVAAGYVQEAPTAKGGGHAYCCYCRTTDNEWVVLDWCFFQDTLIAVVDKPLLKTKTEYKEVWFSFNHKYVWSHINFELSGRLHNEQR